MSDKFLRKIVKKNYNNKLEEVLEHKDFSLEVKNALLNIFYKIENGYNDYQKTKQETYEKNEYIEKIIKIIKNDCNKIELLQTSDENQEKVDSQNKEIVCLPIETHLLYFLAKIQKRNLVVKYLDESIEKAFTIMLNTGNNINMVEPLRDFNGFSWNVITKEIEDLNYNLIYQNIVFLVGNEFADKWVNNYEPLVDYFDLFEAKIKEKYGPKIEAKIIPEILKLSIITLCDKNEEFKEEIKNKNDVLEKELEKMENREQYLAEIAKNKKQKEQEIKQIDKTINDKELLMQEYTKRNSTLPLEKKIFSVRILKNILKEERNALIIQIEEYNKMMKPKNFLDKKEKLQKQLNLFKYCKIKDYKKEIENSIIKLQKEIIKCMYFEIRNAEDKNSLIELIYKYRYYVLLPINQKNIILEEIELKESINKLTACIISKANEMKVLNKLSENSEINNNITKELLISKIISLEDINVKLLEKNGETYLKIYDEEIEDSIVKLTNITKEELKIKLGKKTKLFL